MFLFALPLLLSAQQQQPPRPDIITQLKTEAAAVRPLMETELARKWLDATSQLQDPGVHVIHRVGPKGTPITEEEFNKLSEDEKKTSKTYNADGRFYYLTGYGTPLAYARVVDVAAKNGFTDFKGKRVVDFGYGGIGHLKLSAFLGADMVGIEVDPWLRALYEKDSGPVGPGSIKLVNGFWPGGEGMADQVGGKFDLFVSKNTLKKGYVHPERPANPDQLINLGVTDEEYLKAVWNSLNPGGLFIVYNLSPAQNPPDKPFLPMADGRFPFERELVEKVGFKVLAFDVDDGAMIRKMGKEFGWGTPEQLETTFFAHYTVLKKP